MANGTRGHTVDVVLDLRERKRRQEGLNVCVAMSSSLDAHAEESDEDQCTRWAESGVLPVAQLTTMFAVASVNGKRMPTIPACVFTDDHAHVQMMEYCVADIDSSLSG